MFYYLFNYLSQMNVPGAGMFKYVSFRSAFAFIFALLIATLIGKRIIRFLQKKQIGETIRDLDLAGQMAKKGTPTMGGIIIIISILLPVLLFGKLDNVYILLMIVTTLWLGAMGFLDDYIKVFKKDKEGLHGRFKILGQVGLGLIVGLTLYMNDNVVIYENTTTVSATTEVVEYAKVPEKSTKTTIPFVKNPNFDYADLFGWAGDYAQTLGWIFFVLVVIFIVTAVSNGANPPRSTMRETPSSRKRSVIMPRTRPELEAFGCHGANESSTFEYRSLVTYRSRVIAYAMHVCRAR